MRYILILSLCVMLFGESFKYQNKPRIYQNINEYINKVAISIATQLEKNKKFKNSNDATIYVVPNSSMVIKKINQNLINQLQIRDYHIIDNLFCKKFKPKEEIKSKYILLGNFIRYENGIIISYNIINKKTNIITSSSQVFIPKKFLKSIDKEYNKDGWFNK